MGEIRPVVVGMGATGTVLAAALLSRQPETILVGRRPALKEELLSKGIQVSGAVSYRVPARHVYSSIEEMRGLAPNVIFLCTKTFHLVQVLEELETIFRPGTKIVSAHNGLGTEDLIAERFGADAAFRMTLNFGASLGGFGASETAFFNRPNHLGGVASESREAGLEIAKLLTGGGLDTEYVDDIKKYVWKKMVMKCSMASICAVTDRTISEALRFQPTREIAEACFAEALAVAKACGYDLGADYIGQAVGYLEKVGSHKDSMCDDIANKRPTEIDFLGSKVVEYGRQMGVPTPYYVAMTNLVKSIEDRYLNSD